MPSLPSKGGVPMLGQAGPSRQAYLIKLPEDIISALESSQGASVTVGMDGSVVSLPSVWKFASDVVNCD